MASRVPSRCRCGGRYHAANAANTVLVTDIRQAALSKVYEQTLVFISLVRGRVRSLTNLSIKLIVMADRGLEC
jgi:hypothetical protein